MGKYLTKLQLTVIGAAGILLFSASCAAAPSKYAPLFINQTLYLCCNMYYNAPRFSDVNYQHAKTFVPLGTPVRVVGMSSTEVTFIDLNTNRRFTWVKRYARADLASLMNVWFVKEDPRGVVERFDGRIKQMIYAGKADVGMTKQQVIFALGFPPHHKTPDTSLDTWTYWDRNYYTVNFHDGVVTHISK